MISLNSHPPGVIIVRIIGIKHTVKLVVIIPSAPIAGRQAKSVLKGAGDLVSVLGGGEAICKCLPIQHQRLTVDVKLLEISAFGSDGQGNGVADSVVHLISSNRTVFKSGDCKSDCFLGRNSVLSTALVSTLNSGSYVAVVFARSVRSLTLCGTALHAEQLIAVVQSPSSSPGV